MGIFEFRVSKAEKAEGTTSDTPRVLESMFQNSEQRVINCDFQENIVQVVLKTEVLTKSQIIPGVKKKKKKRGQHLKIKVAAAQVAFNAHRF